MDGGVLTARERKRWERSVVVGRGAGTGAPVVGTAIQLLLAALAMN
eukprot:CAMPEP_0178641428 /NCGR_PEP_ID=MMETSP0698-20121128/16577_1 /TAXON_ID=265572 /ORGANISM="Extubocellulus spinifer, Strain CCMP396" /LENGTH=45 /DNA_ID= /DNA_START= /DNA_END= /DNA_ORIENTATION=